MGPIEMGVATAAKAGEDVCADRYVVRESRGEILVAALDGLGHGSEAARAATEAVRVLTDSPMDSPTQLVRRCHGGLQGTRGVVMTLACIDLERQILTWVGVGDVSGVLFRAHPDEFDRPRESVVLRGGVVGHALPRLQPKSLPIAHGDTLVLATDGVAEGFEKDRWSTLFPQQIADQILARYGNGSDDALVLVVRYLGKGAGCIRDLSSTADELTEIMLACCENQDEASLTRAYEVGRRALGADIRLLDVAGLQNEALVRALRTLGWSEPLLRPLIKCQGCQLEVLSAYELTQQGAREANAVLRHFNDMLEGEIQRIAHNLHGEAGQLLVAAHLQLSDLERRLGGVGDEVGDRLARLNELLRELGEQIRRITHEIRPTILDDLGLVPALEFLREGVEQRNELKVRLKAPARERFPRSIEVAVYRILQEALNNVVRHARASEVEIRLTSDSETLHCVVKDDGVGFDPDSLESGESERGFGLVGMKERLLQLGGSLRIRSAPGRGTELLVSIPLVH